jgi:hypothetical protein
MNILVKLLENFSTLSRITTPTLTRIAISKAISKAFPAGVFVLNIMVRSFFFSCFFTRYYLDFGSKVNAEALFSSITASFISYGLKLTSQIEAVVVLTTTKVGFFAQKKGGRFPPFFYINLN